MADCRVPQRGGSVNNGRAKETKGEFVLDVLVLAEMLQMGVNCNLLGPKEIGAEGRGKEHESAGGVWLRLLDRFRVFGELYRLIVEAKTKTNHTDKKNETKKKEKCTLIGGTQFCGKQLCLFLY